MDVARRRQPDGELYSQGRTTTEIAVELGVDPRTVHRRLVAAGVVMRPSGVQRKVTDAELFRLRGEGLLWREVAERVGMTEAGVRARRRRLRAAGHPEPTPPPPPDPAVALYLSGMTTH